MAQTVLARQMVYTILESFQRKTMQFLHLPPNGNWRRVVGGIGLYRRNGRLGTGSNEAPDS